MLDRADFKRQRRLGIWNIRLDAGISRRFAQIMIVSITDFAAPAPSPYKGTMRHQRHGRFLYASA